MADTPEERKEDWRVINHYAMTGVLSGFGILGGVALVLIADSYFFPNTPFNFILYVLTPISLGGFILAWYWFWFRPARRAIFRRVRPRLPK